MTVFLDGTDLASFGCVLNQRSGWLDALKHRQNLVGIPQAISWDDLAGDPAAARRVVVAGGAIVGSSHADLDTKIRALNAFAANGVLRQVEFSDTPGIVIDGYAHVEYRELRPILGQRAALYRVILDCPDPRLRDKGSGVPLEGEGAGLPPGEGGGGNGNGGGLEVPEQISGLTVWLDADAMTGLNDGEEVDTWQDTSGNGIHFITSDGFFDDPPIYRKPILNGKAVVRFVSAALMHENTDFWVDVVDGKTGSVFLVQNIDSGDNNQSTFGWNTSSSDSFESQRWSGDLRIHVSWGNETEGAGGSRLAEFTGSNPGYYNMWSLHEWSRNGNLNHKYVVNGTTIRDENQTGGFTAGLKKIYVGRANNLMTGWVAEIIIYDRVLTSEELSSLRGYVLGKWNVGPGA